MKAFAQFIALKKNFSYFLFGLLLSSCASDRYLGSRGHSLFLNREYTQAAEVYLKDSEKPGVNQFLFLVDLAMSYFVLGEYDKAIPVFLKAEKISEIKDYTSVSEEVGTLVTSDNVRGYKGEDFEKVLINVYLALSFAAVGKIESAQVEARKINLLLYRMINEGKRNYEESPFARYLAAMLWETSNETNSAYIDYKKTFELDPQFPGIGEDLLATSRKMNFMDEHAQWIKTFSGVDSRKFEPNQGELVVIFEQGLSPKKIPRDGQGHSSLPRFVKRYGRIHSARVWVGEQSFDVRQKVLDIEELSVRYLEDRIGRMVAKKMAGAAVKGAIAAGIGSASKDSDLGVAVFYLLMATDRADLRSWLTLPGSLMMSRIAVPAGVYPIRIEALDHSGQKMYEKDFGSVQIKAKTKRFLISR
jgi:hypothetical protein